MSGILRPASDLGSLLPIQYTPPGTNTDPVEETGPGFLDKAQAAMNRTNILSSAMNYWEGSPGGWSEQEKNDYYQGNYSWLDSLKGSGYEEDEEMVTALSEARTPREFDWIRGRVERQRRDLEVIGKMTGLEAFTYNMGAAVLDPVLAPLVAIRAPIAVGRAAQATWGAGMGLAGSGMSEAGLQMTQDTRTLGESALNIGVGTAFGGLAQYLFSVPLRAKVARIHNETALEVGQYEQALSNARLRDEAYAQESVGGVGEVVPPPGATANPFLAPQSGGAATAYDPRLVNPSVARQIEAGIHDMALRKGWGTEREAMELKRHLLDHSREWTGLKNESAVAWAATFTPSRWAAKSPSPTARLTYELFVEDSWLRNRNIGDEGMASTQSITTEVQANVNRLRAESRTAMDTFYKTYAKRVPKGQRMSKDEFAEEIGIAMSRRDPHPVDEIATAAGYMREKVVAPLEAEGLRWGIIEADPVTGMPKGRAGDEQFLWRLFDTHKIRQRSVEFRKILKDFYMEREMRKLQAKADKHGVEIERDMITEIESDLEEWVSNLVTNMTNVQHGNVHTTVIGATRQVRESNRFKQSTLDIPRELIEDFLTKDIRQIVEQVSRSILPQYALLKRFYQPGDKNIDISLRSHYDAIAREFDDLRNIRRMDMIEEFARKKKQSINTYKPTRKEEEQIAKELNKIIKREKADVKRLSYAHKAALLQNPHDYDPESFIVKSLRTLRALNVFSKLGKMTVSAFPDIGITFMRNGTKLLPATVKAMQSREVQVAMSELEAAVRGAKGSRVAVGTKDELRKMGLVLETAYLGRVGEISALSHPDPGSGKWNNWLTSGLHKFGTATGMNHWNQSGKTIAVHRGLLELYEAVNLPAAERSAYQKAELRRLGIDERLAVKIKNAYASQNAATKDKVYIPLFTARGLSEEERAARTAILTARREKRKNTFIEAATKKHQQNINRKRSALQGKLTKTLRQIDRDYAAAQKEYKFAATNHSVRRKAKARMDDLQKTRSAVMKEHGAEVEKLNKQETVTLGEARKKAAKKFDTLLVERGEYLPPDSELIWDFEVQGALRSAMTKLSNESIITPTLGDRPEWMVKPWGAMIAQFLSFPMAVMAKAVGPAVQRGDTVGRTIAGGLMTVPLAMLSQYFKHLSANNYDFSKKDFEQYMSSRANWERNMLYHTGLLGIHTELFDMADLSTSGRLAEALGMREEHMSRFEQESAIYSRLGAGVGMYQDLASVTMGGFDVLAGDGFSKKRVRDLRYLWPFQNHPVFQPLFNYAQEALSE